MQNQFAHSANMQHALKAYPFKTQFHVYTVGIKNYLFFKKNSTVRQAALARVTTLT